MNDSHLQISSAQQKKFKKLTLALPGGAVGVLGAHLQIVPVNYAYKFFSAHPWGGGADAPTAPPCYACDVKLTGPDLTGGRPGAK